MGEAETVNEVGGRGRKREEEDAIKTFQANVWHGLFDGIAEVSLCRLKKILSNEDEKKKIKKKKKSRHNGKQEVEQDKPSLVKSFDSGLVIEELSEGKPRGKKAFVGLKVAVRYTGKLMENDKIFYNNMGEGGEPFEFRLAAGQAIKGFEIGVVGVSLVILSNLRMSRKMETKDDSTDDAFKILEEEEPRDESGTLKRPKKKKHHLNVTDEEENLIVIKGNTDSPLSDSEDEDGFSLRESKSKSATSKKSDGIEDEDTHEEALNEKARGTDVDERKGLQRIVCEDTSKTYGYQR
ncbi:hypothetical protein CQW23_34821 [Capsicum baccatum]|uniref:peptidylprolyl isomerase n=1 Tax=Capsicum baccatum TaxID=33114 RepID=A0A2G2UY06_CAPBA|nr:hypothetical protein CQW23_34821 [Capsicum baccatum]